ncbi:MAG: ABC transporter substrate-binding protein [Actinobacteria bacterium]|nr:ABC transporter substrate-binding protein [Actinomycetota bacterium]
MPACRKMLMTLAILSMALLVVGCGSSDVRTTTSEIGTATSAGVTATSAPTLSKLTLVAPPGPMAVPMAYLAVNDKLVEVAEETELVIWENADQLKAIVAGRQGDFVTMPSNNAAVFYNKGLEIKLLDISVWNITYLVTADPQATGFSDIKGQSLVVSLQGSVPDVMFRFLCAKEGLDPEKDFAFRYATDPTQAAQLLLAGQVDNAVLSEALATAVVMQTKTGERPLRKALAFDAAWVGATTPSDDTPIAGTVATPRVLDAPWVVATFQREYQAAVDWMLEDPVAAGELVETELPQLGLKAPIMTASLESITWRFTPADVARPYLERFYANLAEFSPEVIGGRSPDDAFYYVP